MQLIFKTISTFLLIGIIEAQDPPNVKWNQINTEHFEIIFPMEISAEGLVSDSSESVLFFDVQAAYGFNEMLGILDGILEQNVVHE